MSLESKCIPASSQTVGPFFRIGLQHLIEQTPAATPESITICGRVLDRDGVPVSDAMLEFWAATENGNAPSEAFPRGFRRIGTDDSGAFSVTVQWPRPLEVDAGATQAPHLLVLVFARGLLRHLITRVYFDDQAAANASDPVLLSVPDARRNTLIARREGTDSFHWDVILQGDNETVFFAW